MLRLLLLPGILGLAACARKPALEQGLQEGAALDRQVTAFRVKYARFEVPSANLPPFEKKKFERPARRTLLADAGGIRAGLQLGARTSPYGNSVFRSQSRYRLTDSKGRVLATAESTLSAGLPRDDDSTYLLLFSDSARSEYLIAEEAAWSTRRFILMNAATGAVRYLRIPAAGEVISGMPHFLGLHDDKVYIEQSGKVYALPTGTLEQETTLDFAIG